MMNTMMNADPPPQWWMMVRDTYAAGLTDPWFLGIMGVAITGALLFWWKFGASAE